MEPSNDSMQRFWKFVTYCPTTGCWFWTGSANSRGYGRFGNNLAHRVSFSFHYHDPKHLLVCHKCDAPSCVNPQHLFVGDQKDNMRDCANKLRFRRQGERNSKAKLTANDVIVIRNLTLSTSHIAKLYGVKDAAISKIRMRRTWSHIQ